MKIATKQKIEVKVETKKDSSQSPKNVAVTYIPALCKSCGNKKN